MTLLRVCCSKDAVQGLSNGGYRGYRQVSAQRTFPNSRALKLGFKREETSNIPFNPLVFVIRGLAIGT